MHNDRYLAAALAIAAAVLPALGLEPQETSFDRTLTVTGPVDLDAATRSGAIKVHAGAADSVAIRGVIRVDRADGATAGQVREIQQNPPITQEGNTIRIAPVTAVRGVSVSYEITAPAETKVRARTGSGAVSVEGVRGPADIGTGSGDVAVSRIGGEVRVQTGSGGIKGDALAGPVVARTGSGGIRLEQTTAAAVTAQTGSGAVTVKLPPGAGFDLRARTGSGEIHSDQPLQITTGGGRRLEGKRGGGGPLVEISTGSGGIRIE
jgi:hypothetical protein